MDFRPNCLTCIAHLYLYYTLLVPHPSDVIIATSFADVTATSSLTRPLTSVDFDR